MKAVHGVREFLADHSFKKSVSTDIAVVLDKWYLKPVRNVVILVGYYKLELGDYFSREQPGKIPTARLLSDTRNKHT